MEETFFIVLYTDYAQISSTRLTYRYSIAYTIIYMYALLLECVASLIPDLPKLPNCIVAPIYAYSLLIRSNTSYKLPPPPS